MSKKKPYQPQNDDDWDEGAASEHRRIINEKSKTISETYKKWWDKDKKTWRRGFKRDDG
tara:strand:- start:1197 stop:1373 length:177 start_codon:yes stop_codon:yes gene_type:complete